MKYYEISPKNIEKLTENDDDLFADSDRVNHIKIGKRIARSLRHIIDRVLPRDEEFQELQNSDDPKEVDMAHNVIISFEIAVQYFDKGNLAGGCGALEPLVNYGEWDEWAKGVIEHDTGIDMYDLYPADNGEPTEYDRVEAEVVAAWKNKGRYENESALEEAPEIAEPPERPRKQTKTKTKNKPDVNYDPFQQQQDQPLTNRPEEPQGQQRPQGPTIRRANQADTQRAAAGVRLPPEAMRHLQNLGNIEIDPNLADYPARPQEPEFLPSTRVNTENLPTVAGQALAAEGITSPAFHQVASLPGNMSRMIRQLGKLLFGSMTTTATEDIYMIGNLGGQGPNTRMDVNSVANFVREHGEDLGPGDIDFDRVMPGYTAQTHQYVAAGIRWLLVRDFAGEYIYCWPETDSTTPANQAQLGNDPRRLGENDDDMFASSHRVQKDIEDYNHPLKDVGNCDKTDYDMLINEIDYTINVLGDSPGLNEELSLVIDQLEYSLDPALVKFLDSVLAGAIAVGSDRFNSSLVQALRDGEQQHGTEPRPAVHAAVDALVRGWKDVSRTQDRRAEQILGQNR